MLTYLKVIFLDKIKKRGHFLATKKTPPNSGPLLHSFMDSILIRFNNNPTFLSMRGKIRHLDFPVNRIGHDQRRIASIRSHHLLPYFISIILRYTPTYFFPFVVFSSYVLVQI
ncbi:hypothetical protein Droror1_Dr00018178 [Drosera rotundifolia]